MLYSDQDDVFNPEKMSRLMDAMQNAERQWGRDLPILVFSDQTVVDEKLNVIEPSLMRCQKQAFDSFDYHALLIQNVVTGGRDDGQPPAVQPCRAMPQQRADHHARLVDGGDSGKVWKNHLSG